MTDMNITSSSPQLPSEVSSNKGANATTPQTKNLTDTREQDTLEIGAEAAPRKQRKINVSSALAGVPEPFKKDNVSLKDTNYERLTGTSGAGNGWFGMNALISITVALNEMQMINRDQLMAESQLEITSMKMTYEYGQDAASAIMTAAQKEAAMHYVSAAMGGFTAAMAAGKIAGSLGAFNKTLSNTGLADKKKALETNKADKQAKLEANQKDINELGKNLKEKTKFRPESDINADIKQIEIEKETTIDNTKIAELDSKKLELEQDLVKTKALTPDEKGNYPDSLEVVAKNDSRFKADAEKLFDKKADLEGQMVKIDSNLNDLDGRMVETVMSAFQVGEGVAKVAEGVAKGQLTVQKAHEEMMRTIYETSSQIRRQQMDKASKNVDEVNASSAKLAELLTSISKSYHQASLFTRN